MLLMFLIKFYEKNMKLTRIAEQKQEQNLVIIVLMSDLSRYSCYCNLNLINLFSFSVIIN